MIIGSKNRGAACNLPLGVLVCTLLVATFTTFELTQGKLTESLVGALFTAGLGVYFLSELRWMNTENSKLTVKTVFKQSSLNLAQTALGISVHYGSQGHHSYTIYALAQHETVSLATTGSSKHAEKTRTRLSDLLFSRRIDSTKARAEQRIVEAREHHWRTQQQEAQNQVDAYYSSGKFRRVGLWIALIVALYVVSMGIFMAIQ